jgi:acetyl-CoA carboxylase carboxyl transferase subunit alpha
VAVNRDTNRPAYEQSLPFERRLIELENALESSTSEIDRRTLAIELERERRQVFENLSPWMRVQMARHPLRPKMLDYTTRILDDLVELHGDRCSGEDAAMVGGIGRFQGRTIMVVGQQKGVTTEEKLTRQFGMAHPTGYRKALRLFATAERLRIPVVTFVDTPAAHPGVEAEQGGQGCAIATNLLAMLGLKTPILALVIGEGGSGGALGVAVGDWVAMLEHAIYVICPPERCAEILWRDVEKKELAASALRVTARELKELGALDEVLPEPSGGAHRNPDAAAKTLAESIDKFLADCDRGRWLPENRQRKFERIGAWREPSAVAPAGE